MKLQLLIEMSGFGFRLVGVVTHFYFSSLKMSSFWLSLFFTRYSVTAVFYEMAL